jgi:hypothetical protein
VTCAADATASLAGLEAIVDLMRAAPTLAADRAFNVFGDHSYRMDLRG